MNGVRTRVALLSLAALLTYWNALSGPFILDDQTSIVTNRSIETMTLPGPLVTPSETPVARRPLVNLSFAVNYALGEREVSGYHAGNLLIHILAALALFAVVRRTLLLPPLAGTFGPAATSLAWACALIWVLHPLNSEIVDYVTQRSEGMLGLFYLLTFYCAIRAAVERRRQRWEAAAVASCAAGMLCKESMITSPVLLLLYDRAFLFDSWRSLAAARKRLYAGLAASWVLLAFLMQSSTRSSAGLGTGLSSWDYLLNQARLVTRYLVLTVWPRDLVVDYGMARTVPLATVVVPGLLLLAAAAVVLVGLKRWPRAAFPGAWFFVTLAPTSSVVPIVTEVGAERRMYLPLAGLVVLAVVGVYLLVQRMRVRTAGAVTAALCASVCVLLAAATVQRNGEYADPVRLAETVVDRWPSGRAHVTLGTRYMDRGERAAAIHQFRRAAEIYAPGHFALGVALVDDRRVDEGLAHLREFVSLAPQHDAVTGARDLIGRILFSRGDLGGASREFEQMIAHEPRNPRATVMLADVRLAQGRTSEAIALYERGYRLDSAVGRDAAVMSRYGDALASSNRLPEAERVFAEAARANPRDPLIQKLWGRSLAAMGRFAAAAERFRNARALAPADSEARDLVVAIERRLGAAQR